MSFIVICFQTSCEKTKVAQKNYNQVMSEQAAQDLNEMK